MTVPTSNDTTLSADECRALRAVVRHMIPANAHYGVPSADDALIFADILASLGRDEAAVRAALRRLDALCGGPFADLDDEQQAAALQQFRDGDAALVPPLVNATVRCYYRDDRVMRALGMEARAPFPKGFDIPPGDWSMLEPVRARGQIFRKLP